MKRLLIAFALLVGFTAFSSIDGDGPLKPVEWKTSFLEIENGEYVLKFTATIDDHWHVYSHAIPEGGPIPTDVTIDEISGLKTQGMLSENGKMVTKYDPNFEMDLKWYDNEVSFSQRFKADSGQIKIKGYLIFMTCDDKQCLPPAYVDFDLNEKDIVKATKDDLEQLGIVQTEKSSFWYLFIGGFLGGLIALLTPCVFPMIPLTVSFFTKQGGSKGSGVGNAILYGVSIIVIYVVIGLLVTAIFGEDALNGLSTNPWLNVAFFILFVVFASSFFGAFEITLPSSWINKADSASNKGGIIGIFFMAATLGLVSFSCTGPIVGNLLVEAATKGAMLGPAVGMFGFSFALALPFTLFALFPGWLNSLPKSGGWLNSVKVVLGFLELGFALKFLSTADQVMHWGILDREVYLAFWIVISILLGMYLLGKLKFSHDSELPFISVTRLFLAIFSFAFAVYLIPGMWGAPLKSISGYLPHMGSQDFIITAGAGSAHSPSRDIVKKNSTGLHCPNGIDCFFDIEQAKEISKKEGKPILLDFTGQGCVNCRKMENSVWLDDKVKDILSNKVILTELYVDDRTDLDEPYLNAEGKKVRTIGDRWAAYQSETYGTQSQPYYVILDSDGNQLSTGRGYNEDIEAYLTWLNEGISKFK